jgi:SAM-dependent methyltransferase
VTPKTGPWRIERPIRTQTVASCPICSASGLEYAFVIEGAPVWHCHACGFMFQNPPPGGDPRSVDPAIVNSAEAGELLASLTRYCGAGIRSLLLVNLSSRNFDSDPTGAGMRITGISLEDAAAGSLEDLDEASYDACVLHACLEKLPDASRTLAEVRRILGADGVLLVTAASLDSRAAQILGSRWWAFNPANYSYFSVNTLQNLLIRANFGLFWITRERGESCHRQLSALDARLPHSRLARLLLWFHHRLPTWAARRLFSRFDSHIHVMCRPADNQDPVMLSVIMPVYNESKTVGRAIDRVLGKKIEGVIIELVIVESNSSDGSREEVLKYRNDPRVSIIFEDRPRGKGHAVRAGLKAAKGAVVLIQDADLEYDVDDYDSLLRPILSFEQNFVLGSRHGHSGSSWKIRHFHDSAFLAQFFNFGHALFLVLFNSIYRQTLNDPFTMFKVFRRDCIYGLRFDCNRFDFDFELVIKLIRKGYQPVEVPVNYQSRPLSEGKKVTMFRDPLTWLRALARLRFAPIYVEGRQADALIRKSRATVSE